MLSINDLRETLPTDVGMEVDEGSSTLLSCKEVLRFLPGKRLVCRAEWQGEPVIAKIFTGRRGQHGYAVERRGTQRLKDRGILTPEIKSFGRIPDLNGLALLYEEVEKSRTLHEAWGEDMAVKERDALMRRAVSVLARHHENGILQSDMHLQNFLLSGDKVYTIDASSVTECAGEVPNRRAIDNLAMLLSQMYLEDGAVHRDLFAEYEKCRGSAHGELNFSRLQDGIRRGRRQLKRNLRNKTFRDCTAFSRKRITGGKMICRREFLSSGLGGYLENIDDRFEGACKQYLKQGGSSTVCLMELDGVDFVVKRYNLKSLWRNLRRLMRTSRASRTWSNGHNLLFYNIATARPVALIDKRSWLLPDVSYFVSEYVPGDHAWDYFRRVEPTSSEAVATAQRIISMIRRLGEFSFGHGDLKATNIVISPDGPFLMDLDALVQHRSKASALRAHRADVKRFLANWKDMPSVRALFEELAHDR